jgi:D-serine deaminase-like pyridoxal phosphate-dependent protein
VGAASTGTAPLPPPLAAAVAELRQRPIAATEKGFGILAAREPVTAASLSERRPSLFGPEFTTPLLVLRESAVAHNISAMAAYCRRAGVRLAPHAKTTMAPQLIARQLAAGAWAVTAATIGQVQVYRAFGVPRVLLASELTDRNGVAWLAGQLAADPGFECYVYADSLPGVRLLAEGMAGGARPLPVLVELGYPGGRTGCRNRDEALTVAAAVTAAGPLRLAGVAGFEGLIGHDRSPATLAAVAGYCRELRALAGALVGRARGPLILTAGGSAFFDLVVAELAFGWASGTAPEVVLRSGVYLAFDHGRYAATAPGCLQRGQPQDPGSETGAGPLAAGKPRVAVAGPGAVAAADPPALVPALELWAHVLSRPEPGLALANAGRRDVSFDAGFPVPLWVRSGTGPLRPAAGIRAVRLDDQHCYLSLPPDAELAPGDLVCLGVSHPCTTFDKWRVIPVADDSYQVVDAVHTFF